jgi:hypothetical protein
MNPNPITFKIYYDTTSHDILDACNKALKEAGSSFRFVVENAEHDGYDQVFLQPVIEDKPAVDHKDIDVIITQIEQEARKWSAERNDPLFAEMGKILKESIDEDVKERSNRLIINAVEKAAVTDSFTTSWLYDKLHGPTLHEKICEGHLPKETK